MVQLSLKYPRSFNTRGRWRKSLSKVIDTMIRQFQILVWVMKLINIHREWFTTKDLNLIAKSIEHRKIKFAFLKLSYRKNLGENLFIRLKLGVDFISIKFFYITYLICLVVWKMMIFPRDFLMNDFLLWKANSNFNEFTILHIFSIIMRDIAHMKLR